MLDAHTDVPMRLFERAADLRETCPDRHIDLPRLRAGGVDAFFAALYVPSALSPDEGLNHALRLYDLMREQCRPGGLALVRTVADARAARQRGEIGVFLGLENGRCLTAPGALERLDEIGIRYVTLTHIKSHEWCDASTDQARNGGLSPVGRAIIGDLNRRGILVDVSHISDDAVRQAVEISEQPVVASHSSARALCDHPRNLPDELVELIAHAGGVVMANAFPAFIAPQAAAATNRFLAENAAAIEEIMAGYFDDPDRASGEVDALMALDPPPPVPLATYIDHLWHLAEVAGADHVGIGTDLDGIPVTPVGLSSAADFPQITGRLLERGMADDDVVAVLGSNLLRILEAAESWRRSGRR